MTTAVKSYEIRFFGGEQGHLKSRAQIALYDEKDERLGFIRFKDTNMEMEADAQRGDVLTMNLPSAMFASVLDVLRNEEPVTFHYAAGKCFLSTEKEAVGEGENGDGEDTAASAARNIRSRMSGR